MQVSENVRDKTKSLGEHQDFPPKIFLSHNAEYFVGQPLCAMFQKLSGSERFLDKGGLSSFSVEKIFSHSAEIFRRGIFYCFINFRYRKMLGIKERGEHQDFLSKIISLTVPKNFVGQPFCAVFQKFSGSEKVYGEKGGGSIKIARRIIFLSQCRKIS